MARSPWSDAILAQAVHMRVNLEMGWVEIRDTLFPSEDVTVDAVRIKVNRAIAAGATGEQAAEPKRPAEPEFEIQAAFIKNDYDFDGEKYYFPVNNQIVKIPKATWERIVAAYSGEGANEVQAAIAMEIGMHKKVLEACLRTYGHFKARPPVTREALAAATTPEELEPLYDAAIEVKEARFVRGLRERRLRTLEVENAKMQRQLADRDAMVRQARDLVKSVADDMPLAEPLPFGAARVTGNHLIAPLFDQHFGVRLFNSWGRNFSTDMAAHFTRAYGAELVDYLRRNTDVSDTTILIGGDIFHAFLQQTKRGTLLEREMPDRMVFRIALSAIKDLVFAVRAEGVRVQLLVIPGNHDHIFAELFEEALAAHFSQTDGIVVPNEMGKRKYIVVGNSMHLFDHGEGFETLAAKQFGKVEIIARLTGRQDFHRIQRVYLYVGHTHHLEMKAHGAHLEIIRSPHAAGTTEFEEEVLAESGEPQGVFFRLDANGRMKGMERVYMLDYPLPQAA